MAHGELVLDARARRDLDVRADDRGARPRQSERLARCLQALGDRAEPSILTALLEVLLRETARHGEGVVVGDFDHFVHERKLEILRHESGAGALDFVRRRHDGLTGERLAMAGVRFNDLITDYRCRLAKELLLKTDERIEVIVERTGFSEPSTFYRAFKRWVGETPVEFRKRGKV